MRIESVSVEAYRLPPASPWEDATNKVDGLEFVVVEMTTENGLVGTGFTYTVDVGGTAIKTLIEDYLVNLVIGMDARDYERIWTKLNRQSRRLGLGVNSMAIAALDIAVWDLMGKHYKQSLYRLLGGARGRIASYISEINLGSSDTIDDLLRRVDDYRAQGYDTVKIKIGRDDFAEDLERVERVVERLGSGRRLLVDLN
jgi:L-alanine-DL-glutamate epimerase-like enolase superfamily enzyme